MKLRKREILILCLVVISAFFTNIVEATKTKTKSNTKLTSKGKYRKSETESESESELMTKARSQLGTVFQFFQDAQAGASNSTNSTDSSNTDKESTNATNYLVDLADPNVQIAEWMSIKSRAFLNPLKYPVIKSDLPQRIKREDSIRVNERFVDAQAEGCPNQYNFWFKIRGAYIYYFATKEDINILGSVLVNHVEDSHADSPFAEEPGTCFKVTDAAHDRYSICASTHETKMKLLCSLQKLLQQELDTLCLPEENRKVGNVILDTSNKNNTIVEVQKHLQPMIIIPAPSRKCNEKWTYEAQGSDWECGCAEGKEQSPINLPTKDGAQLSKLRPLFQYNLVTAKATETTKDGLLVAGEYINIRYEREALRVLHPNLGKIVTLDGGVFKAEEIVFHSPSEHQINGHTFDLEMQVIHYGISKGDIAKQVVLSFLFKSKPGVYNKFLDKLDFFNLPNPVDDVRDITQDLFIPNVFFTTDDDDVPSIPPFSFYTYEGSLTSPPCTERTTHYVAADPIPLSSTVITLFKEALRKPDLMNDNGEIVQSSDEDPKNARKVQPLNGRSVFIFDHIHFNCPEFKKKKKLKIKPAGHWEKRDITATEYIYVNGKSPSNIPDSFVVSEKEAKGIMPEDSEEN